MVGCWGSVNTCTDCGSGTVLIPPSFTLILQSLFSSGIFKPEVKCALEANVRIVLWFGIFAFECFHALGWYAPLQVFTLEWEQNIRKIRNVPLHPRSLYTSVSSECDFVHRDTSRELEYSLLYTSICVVPTLWQDCQDEGWAFWWRFRRWPEDIAACSHKLLTYITLTIVVKNMSRIF